MAYTKIHAIKATVDKAIDYICNPEKTDEKMFVSSYACSPETAAYDFKYTLDHCRENSPNKAYHLIQAFAPGEVGINRFYIWKISRRKMKTAAKIFPVIRGQLWGKFTFHEACLPYLKLP